MGDLEQLREELTRKLDDVPERIKDMLFVHDPDRMMSTEEVARFCSVHKQEVFRWRKLGLPYYNLGKGHRYKRKEVLQFVTQRRKVERL